MVMESLQPTCGGAGEKGGDHSLVGGRDRRGREARTVGGRAKPGPSTQSSPRPLEKGKERGPLHQHPPWEQPFAL